MSDPDVIRISSKADGSQGDPPPSDGQQSYRGPSISGDGRYVAFDAVAAGLVPGDTNPNREVFLKDTVTGAISIVSKTYNGTPPDGDSLSPHISQDGRFVEFISNTDQITANSDERFNVYVADVTTGITQRVDTSALGEISNGTAASATLSANGRFVAFADSAENDLVPGERPHTQQVYLKDLLTGAIQYASVDSSGHQMPNSSLASISADGRYVVFFSPRASDTPDPFNPADPYRSDVYVRDTLTGVTTLVSATPSGGTPNSYSPSASISPDGRYVAFYSFATDLLDGTTPQGQAYLRDLQTGETTLLSVDQSGQPLGGGGSENFSFSADDRYVTFSSGGSFDAELYLRDRQTNTVTQITTAQGGVDTFDSNFGVLSADGHYVAFESVANGNVPDDTNGVADIFRRTLIASGDTTPPTLAISGVSGATNVVDHVVSGTIDIADAGLAVTVRDGSAVVGTTVSDSQGHWSLPFSFTGDGTSHAYQLTASATDAAGNLGTSTVTPFTLDFSANMSLFGTTTHDPASHGGQVYALYDGLLGRAPDNAGWEFYVPALDRGASPEAIAQSILASPEWTNRFGDVTKLDDKTFVDTLFQVGLGRPADAGGEQSFLAELKSGVSRAHVALEIATSTENEGQIAPAFGTGIFVPDASVAETARLYESLLHRSPDAAGLAYWEAKFAGASPSQVATGFIQTQEYATVHPAGETDQAYVESLYEIALGRTAAGDSGAAGYLTSLGSHTATRADVAVGITVSPEAIAHLAGHIEQGWHLV